MPKFCWRKFSHFVRWILPFSHLSRVNNSVCDAYMKGRLSQQQCVCVGTVEWNGTGAKLCKYYDTIKCDIHCFKKSTFSAVNHWDWVLNGHCDRLRNFLTLFVVTILVLLRTPSGVNCGKYWYFSTILLKMKMIIHPSGFTPSISSTDPHCSTKQHHLNCRNNRQKS